MTNHRYFLMVTFHLCLILSATTHAEQPGYVLDLSSEASLKTVFDSGLRPTNVYGGERSRCEVWNSALILIGRQEVRIPLSAEYVVFSVSGNNEITELFVKTPNLDLQAAQIEATRLFALVGEVPANLIDALRRAKESRSYEPLRNVGGGTAAKVEPQISVGFVPGDFVAQSPNELHVKLGVRCYWKSRVWNGKMRDVPIMPPAGYEQFSMNPVPNPSELRRQREMSATGGTESPSAQAMAPVDKPPRDTVQIPNLSHSKSVTVAKQEESSERSSYVVNWLIGVALLAAGVLLWKRQKR